MKKKVLVISGLCILMLFVLFFSITYYSKNTITNNDEKKIKENISSYNISELIKYTDEKIELLTPIGENSQMSIPVSNKEEYKKYKNVYDSEIEKYNNYYEEKTKIEYSNMIYDKNDEVYKQTVNVSSFSTMGYSIFYNDLILYLLDDCKTVYFEEHGEIESMEITEEIDTKLRTLAVKYTNDYFLQNREIFEVEIEMQWVKKDGELICQNVNEILSKMFDPEQISYNNDGKTDGYEKYHDIAYSIWQDIKANPEWNKNKPLEIIF